MNTGGFGVKAIIPTGNGGQTTNSIPAIDHRISMGGHTNFHAPSLTVPPRLTIIERITPRNVNATAVFTRSRARVVVSTTTAARRISGRATAYGRALTLRPPWHRNSFGGIIITPPPQHR